MPTVWRIVMLQTCLTTRNLASIFHFPFGRVEIRVWIPTDTVLPSGAVSFSQARRRLNSLLGTYQPTTINTKGEFISVTTLLLYLKVLEGQD